jgi:dTDP-4-dehydrorhamnose reductase
MKNKKILITGASGLLGWNLATYLIKNNYNHIYSQFNTSSHIPDSTTPIKVDLRDFSAIETMVHTVKPDIIIHSAALTNVDLCEKEPELAFSINRDSCKYLAQAVRKSDCKLISISTDQLWEGTVKFLSEETPANPINIYGQSKHEGEIEIAKYEHYLILRTNFFGSDTPWKNSFSGWIKENLMNNKSITAFHDVFFTPISIPLLLSTLESCITNNLKGTFNLVGCERVSKYDFAMLYAKQAGLDTSLIKRGSVDDFRFLAKRPKEMSLSCTKISEALKRPMPNLKESIVSIL